MKTFTVMWRIEVNATDHEEAAQLALRELTEGHSKIFEAIGPGEEEFKQVDLSDYPEEHRDETQYDDIQSNDMIYFSASNELPPSWFFDDDETTNTGDEARIKLRQLNDWQKVNFVYIASKKEFIPLLAEYAHCKIFDFKFIFKR